MFLIVCDSLQVKEWAEIGLQEARNWPTGWRGVAERKLGTSVVS